MSGSTLLADNLWQLSAAILVLLMQAGFLLLEAGQVRAKNSVNVAQKNVADLAVCWVAFLTLGFWIAFGLTSPILGVAEQVSFIDFLFQLGFCGAAATIVAGAVAERMRFDAYLALTVVMAAFLYPVTAWLCWGNLFDAQRSAPLADLGFVDFAGGTVVHMLAACVALAAVILLGPRHGRFDEAGQPRNIPGSNPVMSMAGLIILLLGWFGFNGGSLSTQDPRLPEVLVSTASAGCMGGFISLGLGYKLDNEVFNPTRTINGILGGLVIITPCVLWVTPAQACLLGVVGGALALLVSDWLPLRYKIDDPLDVIAVHGAPGLVGTLAVALFLPTDMLVEGSRLSQLIIQFFGCALVAAGAFATAWATLTGCNRIRAVRVTEDDEQLGLNYTEHGISLDTQRLRRALHTQMEGGSFAEGLQQDKYMFDEAGEIALSLNAVLERNEQARRTIESQATRFEHFARTTSDYLWETNAKLALTFFSSNQRSSPTLPIPTNGTVDLFDVFRCDSNDKRDNRRHIHNHDPLPSFRAHLQTWEATSIRILEVTGIPYFDDTGALQGYRGGATDVTERQLAEDRARYLAFHDDLTGLGNRRLLHETLTKMMDDDHGQKTLVIAGIDLDGFKEVNDAYGHATGDQLLEEVAKRLSASLRAGDFVFRTGGDEFVAMLSGFTGESKREDAAQWCQRMIETLQQPYILQDQCVQVGASIGISLFPDDSRTREDLVRMADVAMYRAKVNGKGQVVVFETSMDEDAQRRRELETALHAAFKTQQFFMIYQPKYEPESQKLVGFEALARWRHPERGVLSPADFLPAVEHLQLMPELGRFALNEACHFAAEWADMDIHIAVNISPSHLVDPSFIEDVEYALNASGLRPESLEIEITEEALIADVKRARYILDKLHTRGTTIAVDDFGRGNTSLRYLQQFPLNKLKIDKSFIRGITTDTKAREIARSVVRLGHDLGLQVVAEGVEDLAQLQQLTAWSCDEVQGFYFSKPIDREAAENLVLAKPHPVYSTDNPNTG